MTTMNDNARLIPLTDQRGDLLLPREEAFEPDPGSVVLTMGAWGTAWQRFFSDGLWHGIGRGRTRTWEQMLTQRNLVLVYEAGHRDDTKKGEM